jgi:hypothetical protein
LIPSDECFSALASASPLFCIAAAIAATATTATRARQRHAGTSGVMPVTGYQAGGIDRALHAARSRRWRPQRKEKLAPRAMAERTVTRHGSPEEPVQFPSVPSSYFDHAVLSSAPDAALQAPQRVCPRCAGAISPFLRQFLSRRLLRSSWPAVDPTSRPTAMNLAPGDGHHLVRSTRVTVMGLQIRPLSATTGRSPTAAMETPGCATWGKGRAGKPSMKPLTTRQSMP